MNRCTLIFASFLLFSCSRNSLELPPPKDNILVKEIINSLASVKTIDMKFSQDKYDKEGKVDLELSNLTGQDLNQVKIYVEMCDSNPSFYTCNNQYSSVISQLSSDKATVLHLPFRNIKLGGVFINAGIVSTDTKSQTLSGVYTDGVINLTGPTPPPILGLVKGVVYADGQAVFRLGNIANSNAFNIKGLFSDTLSFNGNFFARRSTGEVDSLTSELSLEVPNTVGIFNENPATFNLLLHTSQTIAGSQTDKIQLKLRK